MVSTATNGSKRYQRYNDIYREPLIASPIYQVDGLKRRYYGKINISRERYIELRNGCAAGKYRRETLREACRGLEFIESWIILSVTKSKSYDLIEFDFKLGRIPIGRSDFYGFRRKFYHNLDVILREECSV